jgi:D-proline reductase (dithiol) PrdB
MPRLEDLSEIERTTALNFPFMDHDDSPNTPLKKPLSQSKVALLTTAGVHTRSDKPFFHGDPTFRVLPSSTPAKDIIQSHVSIGFDRTPLYKDINISYPIDRLQELVDRGVIGSLSESYISFMGAIRNPKKIVEETAPEAAKLLKEQGTDVVLLTPT